MRALFEKVVDRDLSYGRDNVRRFVADSAPFHRVLDIGAGPGTDLLSARGAVPDARLLALEVDPDKVALLRAADVEVHSINIEADRFPFEDCSLDVVIANQVLEHVKELFWIFHEVTRCLRVGGSFIIGVPNLASLHNRLMLLAGLQPTPLKNASAHVRGYTRHDMIRFVNSCFPGGYTLRGFAGGNFYPLPPLLARPLARLLPRMAWGIFFRFEKVAAYEREFIRYPVERCLESNFFVGDGYSTDYAFGDETISDGR